MSVTLQEKSTEKPLAFGTLLGRQPLYDNKPKITPFYDLEPGFKLILPRLPMQVNLR